MTYLLPLVFVLFIVIALSRQKKLKQNFSEIETANFSFYNEDAQQIAKTIIPKEEEITFIDCGLDKETETKGRFDLVAMQHLTKTTSGDFKYLDYYVVAKTTKQIYFIPVKIKGTMKLHLKVNPKIKVEKFPLDQSTTEVIKESSKDMISSFVIQFNSNNKKIHQIEFWGVLKQWK